MIVVRSLLGALNLLWFEVSKLFDLIPLFVCLVCLRSPSDVLIPVDGHKLELVTLVWKGAFCAQLRDLQSRSFILMCLTGCVLFFPLILQPLQIQTRSTSGDFPTMQLDSRSPDGFVFNFSKTPKSPFCLIFTKIMYVVFNLRFSCFSPTLVLGSSLFLHISRLLPVELWLHAVRKFPYMNFQSYIFTYVHFSTVYFDSSVVLTWYLWQKSTLVYSGDFCLWVKNQ